MDLRILRGADIVARQAADLIAAEARAAVSSRGRFIVAFSGGQTPDAMLGSADRDMPWTQTFVFQVDERVVPEADSRRNLSHLRQNLVDRVPLPKDHVFPLPVDRPDLK